MYILINVLKINVQKMIKSESNNVISSFLESSLQDDFYKSLMDDYSNTYDENKILKDDIISVNIDEKGKNENKFVSFTFYIIRI